MEAYITILKEELVPAMGCTEPIALAYGAAKLREALGEIPERIEVGASGSIIKNVKSVIVPNTGHLKGIEAAIAVGIIAGNASKELEVIQKVSKEQKVELKNYLDKTPISVNYLDTDLNFDIQIKGFGKKDEAAIRIANYHTNVVYIEKNGEVLFTKPFIGESEEGLTDRSILNMTGIYEFATTCELTDEITGLLDRQIQYNMAIAQEGIDGSYGANIGSVLLGAYGNGIENKAVAYASAGSDARMNGCEMPVVINSGSGNQGITCSVPVIVYGRETNASEESIYRALLLSNLTAIHQKTGIGRLSAFCGAVCAGVAAGGGIAYLKGGKKDEVFHTVVNGLAIVSGMVCDGAKASCAAKIAMSIQSGLLGYHMFICGEEFKGGDGIISKGIENTIVNIGRLGKKGMQITNQEIIHIMLNDGKENCGDEGSCD
ncbi:serine dehydratase subunit alpha family protein [Aequitasia blattaphilus]|uniref:UPF0597 protein NK125_10620 n=1 Tax=Aequitasia blattaphilus TaxID=2949332 RepID=A0ABT1EAL5_9FIRM|nr:L-serine ammonia-lyase, iron-sulfur-dependent, subunit alpha [Aequitasia blattaphilus]MCP1102870.1 L-serine ammonia-lyase, iron-sulfur-dependent, subunit alpha [Aequitasia blattaphilus]MCR8615510.1 L-serine ammonia-lyase, iron-sulfur-dependent, subunit alpha [Aequitasia blattaphilus]